MYAIRSYYEHKMGNNFGFAAFSAYGSFWIGLGIIWILNHLNVYPSSHTDVGFYLVAWTLITAIFWIGSFFISTAMFVTFSTLFVITSYSIHYTKLYENIPSNAIRNIDRAATLGLNPFRNNFV